MSVSALLSPYRRLPRTMWVLFFVQVINRMGDFVAPFLTLLLTRKLGLSDSAAGAWVTMTVVSSLAGIMVSGRMSDRLGRKPVLAAGMALSAALIGIAGFCVADFRVVWLLVAMSFFQGMVRPSISALIADLTAPDERKDAYALSYLGINIGVAVGPMIAGFLFERNIPWLFWGDTLSSLAALALIAAFIPGVCHLEQPAPIGESADERASAENPLLAFLHRPLLVGFCLLLLVNNFMYSQTHFALPLYSAHLFSERGAPVFGWLMSFNALVVVSLTPLLSALTRRQEPLVSMSIGSALYAVGFGLMALPLNLPLLFFATFIWTLGEIFFSINSGVYLAAKTPRNFRGQFQAYREFITSAGRMAGPLLSGHIVAGAGISSLWLLVGILGIATAALFIRLQKAEKASA